MFTNQQLLTSFGTFCQLVANFGKFCQLLVLNFGQFVATFDNFWQFLATFGNFGQFLANSDNFWQFLPTCGNFWQFLATFANFWLLFFYFLTTSLRTSENLRNAMDSNLHRAVCVSFNLKLTYFLKMSCSFTLFSLTSQFMMHFISFVHVWHFKGALHLFGVFSESLCNV